MANSERLRVTRGPVAVQPPAVSEGVEWFELDAVVLNMPGEAAAHGRQSGRRTRSDDYPVVPAFADGVFGEKTAVFTRHEEFANQKKTKKLSTLYYGNVFITFVEPPDTD